MPLLVIAATAAVMWYSELKKRRAGSGETDPLLLLRGSGMQIWAQEHADDYVRRLREGWK
jgi:hypothetical protein